MTVLYLEALAAIAVSLSVLMAGAWLVQQRTGNSGWVDTIWTFSLGLVGVGSALWPVAGAAPNAAAMAGRGPGGDLVAAARGRISRSAPPGSPTTPAMRRLRGNGASIRRAECSSSCRTRDSDRSRWCSRSLSRRGFPRDALRPAGLSRRADPVGRHRRRGAGRCAAQALPRRSRQQGPGLRCRAVALVAASELFLRMVRLAGLSRDRALSTASIPGAGRRCWRRSSCTGSWSTSPASRRWKRRCCARAATRYRDYQSRTSQFFPLPPQA